MLWSIREFYFINTFIFILSNDYIERCLHIVGSDYKIGFSLWKFLPFIQEKYYIEVKIFNINFPNDNKTLSYEVTLVQERCENSGLPVFKNYDELFEFELEINIFYGLKRVELDIMKASFRNKKQTYDNLIQLEGLKKLYKLNVLFSYDSTNQIPVISPQVVWAEKLPWNIKSCETYCIRLLYRGAYQTFKLNILPEYIISNRQVVDIYTYEILETDEPIKVETYLAEAYVCHLSTPTSMFLTTFVNIISVRIEIIDPLSNNILTANYSLHNNIYVWEEEFSSVDFLGVKIAAIDENRVNNNYLSIFVYPGIVTQSTCLVDKKNGYIDIFFNNQREYHYDVFIIEEKYFDEWILPIRIGTEKEAAACHG